MKDLTWTRADHYDHQLSKETPLSVSR